MYSPAATNTNRKTRDHDYLDAKKRTANMAERYTGLDVSDLCSRGRSLSGTVSDSAETTKEKTQWANKQQQ
eukprot:scaffold201448_cov34-Attheya_sp.AAC.1